MWVRVALTLAFRRANSTHTFRDVILQPDLLTVIADFVGELGVLRQVECGLCADTRLHSSSACAKRDDLAAHKNNLVQLVKVASMKLSAFVVCKYARAVADVSWLR